MAIESLIYSELIQISDLEAWLRLSEPLAQALLPLGRCHWAMGWTIHAWSWPT